MVVKKYFPGFVPKAITFSIDDGNLKYDKVFIDIMRPASIKGTFNLYLGGKRAMTNEEYRSFYSGFEIANHCNRHPLAFDPEKEYVFSDEAFNHENADKGKLYKTDREGVYRIFLRSYWGSVAKTEAYLDLVRETKAELEEIFGLGSIKGFVWPYGKQRDVKLFKALKAQGYNSIRNAAQADFSMPPDRNEWCVNAMSSNFDLRIKEFEDLSDDGELKFFCIGLHSADFERDGKWEELRAFAREYGNRPSDFWYATVSEIFEYEDAILGLEITEEHIKNNSDRDVYISLDGVRCVLSSGEMIKK